MSHYAGCVRERQNAFHRIVPDAASRLVMKDCCRLRDFCACASVGGKRRASREKERISDP